MPHSHRYKVSHTCWITLCMRAHTHTLTRKHTHAITQKLICTCTHVHTCKHAHNHMITHKNAHTRAYTHVHTLTQTTLRYALLVSHNVINCSFSTHLILYTHHQDGHSHMSPPYTHTLSHTQSHTHTSTSTHANTPETGFYFALLIAAIIKTGL